MIPVKDMRLRNNVIRALSASLLSLAFTCAADTDNITPTRSQSYAAVVGSYQRLENAQNTRQRVQALLSLEVEISKTRVNSRSLYRVMIPDDKAGDLVSELRLMGFEDAWLLAVSDSGERAREPSISEADRIVARVSGGYPVTNTADVTAPAMVESKVESMVESKAESKVKSKVVRPVPNPGTATTDPSFLAETLVATIEGIPVHNIQVSNYSHHELDITLDGLVDEPVWQEVSLYDNMLVAVPGTGEPGSYETETRMIATERGLYVSAVMYQPPETLVSRLSTRDDFIDRDTYGVTLDVSGEGLMAYWFIVGLGDSIMDGKVLPERNYQRDWDGPWRGKSARFDKGWSVEMFLPWSMMNMPKIEGARNVGFAVSRQVSHANERYQWPGHPYASSRFVTALNNLSVKGVQPIKQFSVIPYVSSTTDEARNDDKIRAGFDLSWKPSPKLGLTMSGFPDFGAVEADNVVLNLTAFETFFPEKRLFFLEGNEVFNSTPRSNPGNIRRTITNDNFTTTSRKVFLNTFSPAPISLMNTRRIGGTATQVTLAPGVTPNRGETDLPTDLLGASKLTGSIGDVRYGVLAAVEDDVEWLGMGVSGQDVNIVDDGRDFGVARFLYESVAESRRSIGYLATVVQGPVYDAVVQGVDAHYTSGNGRLIVDAQLVTSDVFDIRGEGALLDLKYSSSPRIQHKLELDYFDETVQLNDLGFLSRNDYGALQYALLYNNTRGIGSVKDIRGTVVIRQAYNISRGQITESGIYWRNSMVLPGRNTLKTSFGYLPSRFEDIDSRGNGAYETEERWWIDAFLGTDAAKKLSYSLSLGGLQENLGDWTYNLSAGVTYRPSDAISVDLDVRYKRRHGWMVYQGGRNFGSYDAIDLQPAVKINWFVAPGHQLRFTLQWVGVQADEDGFFAVPAGDGKLEPTARTLANHDFTVSIVTAQLRYRWEIAPLTDFYLVYNRGNSLVNQIDSSFTDLFEDSLSEPIVNSFVAKLRYRFGN